MKPAHICGMVLGIILIIFGLAYPVPEKHLRTNSYDYNNSWTNSRGETYVGGDAYNYQMEASLKAGYMSGVLAMKSINVVGGMILLFLSLFAKGKSDDARAQQRLLKEISAKLSMPNPAPAQQPQPSGSGSVQPTVTQLPKWQCSQCGTMLSANQGVCWQCGTAKPKE